jgi:hypothetical protein
LDLQELAATARRSCAADASESSAQPGAPADVTAPEEFTCLQARAASRAFARHAAALLTPASAPLQVAPGDCRHTALLLGRVGRTPTGRVRAYVYEVRALRRCSAAECTLVD